MSSGLQLFLRRAQYGLVIFGGLYIVAVCLLAVPFFQSQCVFLLNLRVRFDIFSGRST